MYWPAIVAMVFVVLPGCGVAACCSGYNWGRYLGLSLWGAWWLMLFGTFIMVALG